MCVRTLCPLSSSTRNMAFGRGSTTVPSTAMAPFFAKLPDSFRTRKRRPGSPSGATAQVYGPTRTNVYLPAQSRAFWAAIRPKPSSDTACPEIKTTPGGADNVQRAHRTENGVSKPSSTPRGYGPPIMLVEDDESHALFVERVLQKSGLRNPLVV